MANREFEMLFAFLDDSAVAGYAIFFPDYASLAGRQGLYLRFGAGQKPDRIYYRLSQDDPDRLR